MAQDLIHLISWIMAGQPTPPWRLPLRNNGSRRPYQVKPMTNKPLIMGRGVTGLVIHRACPDSSQRNVDLTWLYSIRPRHLFLLKLDGVILKFLIPYWTTSFDSFGMDFAIYLDQNLYHFVCFYHLFPLFVIFNVRFRLFPKQHLAKLDLFWLLRFRSCLGALCGAVFRWCCV